jgi:hypothetical protein
MISYEVMAVSIFTYGSEMWTTKGEGEEAKIDTAHMTFLRR